MHNAVNCMSVVCCLWWKKRRRWPNVDILCGRPPTLHYATLTVTFDVLNSKNWHTGYSCLGEHSHQFSFSCAFFYSSLEPVRDIDGHTDRQDM